MPLPAARGRDRRAAARTPPASTRATSPRPGCGRWPAPPSSPPAAPRCARCTVAPEVLGYIVDLVPGDPAVARRCALGRLAARRDRAAGRARGRGPGCPAATTCTPDDVKALARPTLRHRVAAAPGGRARGRHRRRRARRRPGLRPRPALTGRAAMAVTGRPCCSPRSARWCVVACCRGLGGVLAVVDAVLLPSRVASTSLLAGARARRCGCRRSGDTAVRLGEPATVALTRAQPRPAAGARRAARRLAAVGRRRADRAQPARPAGRRAARGWPATLRPDPARRPAAGRVTVRSFGPLGLAARQRRARRCRGGCGCCRRSPRASTCPTKLARLRELDGPDGGRWCAARAPSSTRCASTSPATTSARSTGGRRRGARDVVRAHLAARARPARAARARHRAGPRPAGSATSRGWTPRWTPRCCSPRWPRGPATGSTCSRTTPGRAAAGQGRAAADVLPPLVARDGPAGAGAGRDRLAGMVAGEVLRRRPAALAGRAVHRPRRRRRSRRACCRCWPALTAPAPGAASPRSPTRGSPQMAAARGRRGARCTTRRPRRSARWPTRRPPRRALRAPGGVTVVDAPPDDLASAARRRLPGAEGRRPALASSTGAGGRSADDRAGRVGRRLGGVQVAGLAGPAARPAEHDHVREERRPQASTPMPIRAQVGSPDGVTNASITPRHAQHRRPARAATPMAARPSAASGATARPRPRVDDRPAQPQPGPGGDEHRGQLEHPVREDQPEEQVRAGRARPSARADHADVERRCCHSRHRTGSPSRTPPTHGERGDARRCSSRPARRTTPAGAAR